jgi:predicted O-methyltransferase YrrM
MDELERSSVEGGVPIVGPSVAALLSVLVRATGARRVLELGTANGYSAIFLARALPEGGRLTTVERDPAMAAEARANLARAGAAPTAEVLVGDALELMAGMGDGSFDLVFMDIDKEMYSAALPHCARLLRPGGLLVCDNVAFRSAGDFVDRLAAHPLFETSFMYGTFRNHSPDEDALSLSVRRAG